MPVLNNRRILLVIGGGIAAYKVLELIRRLRERGVSVRPVLSRAAEKFVTPLSVAAIAGTKVASDLFDLDEESEIGHIRMARDCDLVVVAPATADLLAKMANGLADDLASTVVLATNRRVLVAPAMNPVMWSKPATRRNAARLASEGVRFVGPETGEMAERGESGLGRMAEPAQILAAIEDILSGGVGLLLGKRAIVTSGPTHEPIDPVRYIANRSSGRQGHAIAAALAAAGAEVTLVSGPVAIPAPAGVRYVPVETAREMEAAVTAALPADIAIMAAAVADWRVEGGEAEKIKKGPEGPPDLLLVENPDVLAALARHRNRPTLLIGFAAETRDVVRNAEAKLIRKGCDWIVANDVSQNSGVAGGVMGGERNRVHFITREGVEDWPEMSKAEVAAALVSRIAEHFGAPKGASADVPPGPEPEPDPSELMPAEPSIDEPRTRGAADPGAALHIKPTR